MNVLFANGWAGWLIPLAFIVIGIIANALKSMNEAKPQAPRRRPVPLGGAAPGRPNPQNELEKFLEDLGVKKPGQPLPSEKPLPTAAPATPMTLERPKGRETFDRPPLRRPPPAPKPARRPPRRAAEQVPDEVHRATVSKRHLVSTLQDRHATAIQPTLEQQHLVSAVSKRTVVGDDLAAPREAAPMAAAAKTTTERTAIQLLAGPNSLTRAFMISEVFGAPVSLRGTRF